MKTHVFCRCFRELPNLERLNTRVSPSLSKYGVSSCGGKVELILRDELRAGFDRLFYLALLLQN